MLKVNRKTEYALIVLKHFQAHGEEELTTARMICEKYNTPFDTTSRVMQLMKNHGILSSSQGVKGGYKLSTNLNNINYYKLTELIEGKSIEHDCESINCNLIETCNITGPIKKLNEHLNYFFQTLTIRELLEDTPGPQSLLFKTKAINER